MSEATGNPPVTEHERVHTALSRVLNLSVFFVGVGTYAVVGFALDRTELFARLQLTFFAVGVVVGVVGLLLRALTR